MCVSSVPLVSGTRAGSYWTCYQPTFAAGPGGEPCTCTRSSLPSPCLQGSGSLCSHQSPLHHFIKLHERSQWGAVLKLKLDLNLFCNFFQLQWLKYPEVSLFADSSQLFICCHIWHSFSGMSFSPSPLCKGRGDLLGDTFFCVPTASSDALCAAR